jgi:hypothetical protein
LFSPRFLFLICFLVFLIKRSSSLKTTFNAINQIFFALFVVSYHS